MEQGACSISSLFHINKLLKLKGLAIWNKVPVRHCSALGLFHINQLLPCAARR